MSCKSNNMQTFSCAIWHSNIRLRTLHSDKLKAAENSIMSFSRSLCSSPSMGSCVSWPLALCPPPIFHITGSHSQDWTPPYSLDFLSVYPPSLISPISTASITRSITSVLLANHNTFYYKFLLLFWCFIMIAGYGITCVADIQLWHGWLCLCGCMSIDFHW